MVDLHMHILPGLDDGPSTLEESLMMAEQAAESGINHIAATSHGNYYDFSLAEYEERFSLLQENLRREKIPVTLYPAMEIFMDSGAVQKLEQGRLLTVNHTKYVLVEFPFDERSSRVLQWIEELQEASYQVIVAHPERYDFIQREPEWAYELEKRECVLQVNKGSILGQLGGKCQRLARQFLQDGIVGVIASDAHDSRRRTPSMKELTRLLTEQYGKMETKIWLSENPSRVLKGYPILRG